MQSFAAQMIKFNYILSDVELIKKKSLIADLKFHHFIVKENFFLNTKKQNVFEKYNEQTAPSLTFLNSRHS
jgi:hypothetical protein